MAYTDMRLTCGDCMEPFAFTSEEQGARALHGPDGRPSRCPACHGSRERLRAARALAPVAVSRRRY
jgi:hypothetical protein